MAELTRAPVDVAPLRYGFNGEIVVPTDPQYDLYRAHFNRRFDKHPAVIVRPANTVDVVAAVRFAQEADLEIAISSGGKHPAGFARTDGGIVIDLSLMRAVKVDPVEQTAWLQGGALGGDFIAETARYGLSGVIGWMRGTGVGGVNVHGGFGMVSSKLGWAVDTIVEMEIVTASGEVLRLSPEQNAELFWGARGAGGNFGVVTWVKQKLCRVSEACRIGALVYPADQARDALRTLDKVMSTASDDLTTFVYSSVIPADPGYPEELHDKHAFVINVVHIGSPEIAAEELRPLREVCQPALDTVTERSLYDFMCEMDSFIAPSRQWYDFVEMTSLTDEVLDVIATSAEQIETRGLVAELTIVPHGRGRKPEHPSALVAGRPGGWCVMPDIFWEDPADDAKNIGWADELMSALSKTDAHSDVGYSNVQSRPDLERERRSFGDETWERLVALKRRYDPDNVFHLNHNIPPS